MKPILTSSFFSFSAAAVAGLLLIAATLAAAAFVASADPALVEGELQDTVLHQLWIARYRTPSHSPS